MIATIIETSDRTKGATMTTVENEIKIWKDEIGSLPGVVSVFITADCSQLIIEFSNGSSFMVSADDGYGYPSPMDIEITQKENKE